MLIILCCNCIYLFMDYICYRNACLLHMQGMVVNNWYMLVNFSSIGNEILVRGLNRCVCCGKENCRACIGNNCCTRHKVRLHARYVSMNYFHN
jgi:hypothetical protein